jgi:hypothetical protein
MRTATPGYGGQLTFGSPDAFKFERAFSVHLRRVHAQATRREYRFDGAGSAIPRGGVGADSNDARRVGVHRRLQRAETGTITFFSRVSRIAFTPIVQGDVNGDGRSGDRAFIPNPARDGRDARSKFER